MPHKNHRADAPGPPCPSGRQSPWEWHAGDCIEQRPHGLRGCRPASFPQRCHPLGCSSAAPTHRIHGVNATHIEDTHTSHARSNPNRIFTFTTRQPDKATHRPTQTDNRRSHRPIHRETPYLLLERGRRVVRAEDLGRQPWHQALQVLVQHGHRQTVKQIVPGLLLALENLNVLEDLSRCHTGCIKTYSINGDGVFLPHLPALDIGEKITKQGNGCAFDQKNTFNVRNRAYRQHLPALDNLPVLDIGKENKKRLTRMCTTATVVGRKNITSLVLHVQTLVTDGKA